MIRTLKLGILFLTLPIMLFSQDPIHYPSVMPSSPETAAFAKNVNIPMSYSSGTPQIGISFGTVTSGNMQIPVSLSYNASGIRVEETPTWVGLGWNLNAGGQISRSIRGLPDEATLGFMHVPDDRKARYVDSVHCRCDSLSAEGWEIEHELDAYHILDLEPDIYTFSVLGYSGEFYYCQDSSKFILVPFQNILISGHPNHGFTLTLPEGTKAEFGTTTNSREIIEYGTTASYIDNNSMSPEPMNNLPHTVSWHLDLLESIDGKEISLHYDSERIVTFNRGGERFGGTVTESLEIMRRQTFIKQQILKPVLVDISGESGIIFFKQSGNHRLDMPDTILGSRTLDTIEIRNAYNKALKAFYFEYGYFTSPAFDVSHMLNISQFGEVARKRLYLKSITERNGRDSVPPYEFFYNDLELPSRLSNAQDYWGYYNGKSNGSFLMPRLPQFPFYPWAPDYQTVNQILPDYGVYKNVGGADRRIDTNYNQARMLKKIKYPTGGSTEYFYESNTAAIEYLNVYAGMESPDMYERSVILSWLSVPLPTEPPYPLYFSKIFSINEPASSVRIIPQLPTCTTYISGSCKLLARIRSLPDSTILTEINTTSTFQLQLERGTYFIELFVDESSNDPPPQFNITLNWSERLDSLSYKVGGLRVKRIVSEDGMGNTIRRSFDYSIDSTGKSSGIIEGSPTYRVVDLNTKMQIMRQYYVSNSAVPLSPEGKTVRYIKVNEFYDSSKSSFKSIYEFTNVVQNGYKFGSPITGAPLMHWNWKNNLLKKKSDFEKINNTYRILTEEEHFYSDRDFFWYFGGLYGPQIVKYDIANGWYLEDSIISKVYSYQGNLEVVSRSKNEFFYNNRKQKSKSRAKNSKGELFESKIRYPFDYSDVAGFNITHLISKNALTLPVWQETSVDGKVKSASIVKYNPYGQPIEMYQYESSTLSDTVIHDPDIIIANNFRKRSEIYYDVNGNVRQINNHQKGPVSYIWQHSINGYTGAPMSELPIAMIENADSTSVAYTSFESVSTGNWIVPGSNSTDDSAPTGNHCYYLGSGSISKLGLSATDNFNVSYWSKNGSYSVTGTSETITGRTLNGWTHYSHQVSGVTSITISGTGYIDELRLHPSNAMMSTYSYDYGIGISSMCDVNNKLTYYSYDDLGRLSLVRDENKNIIQKICYSYQGQPVDCGVDTSAYWQPISSICEKDSGINTGNLLVTEKNINPGSATFNLTRIIVISDSGTCSPPVCNGEDKKLINGVCETGVKVCTGDFRPPGQLWQHYYHYLWSDFSTSPTYIGMGHGCLELEL